jgi:hypothetical protein
MSKEPADVSTAVEQYRSNVSKISANIDGIIDRLVENFDNIHANPVVQKQVENLLNNTKRYLDTHILLHTKFNKTIDCFSPLHTRSEAILIILIGLQKDIHTLLLDLAAAKNGNKTIYTTKIIPKLREIVEKYRQLSLIDGLKQCVELVILKPLTMIDDRIIHPIKKWIRAFIGTDAGESIEEPAPPVKDVALAEMIHRINESMAALGDYQEGDYYQEEGQADDYQEEEQGGGRRVSCRRRNKQSRRKKTRKNIRKKTRKNIRKKLNTLY